jgi:hypothetical protein
MTTYFDSIIEAAQKARAQYSVLGRQSDNAEVLKELSVELVTAIAGLVHRAGGDNDYLEPWVEGVSDDIDRCFLSMNARPVGHSAAARLERHFSQAAE